MIWESVRPVVCTTGCGEEGTPRPSDQTLYVCFVVYVRLVSEAIVKIIKANVIVKIEPEFCRVSAAIGNCQAQQMK